jgi:hypothetical protein
LFIPHFLNFLFVNMRRVTVRLRFRAPNVQNRQHGPELRALSAMLCDNHDKVAFVDTPRTLPMFTFQVVLDVNLRLLIATVSDRQLAGQR